MDSPKILVAFLPFEISKSNQCFLLGEFCVNVDFTNVLYVFESCANKTEKCDNVVGSLNITLSGTEAYKDWVQFEVSQGAIVPKVMIVNWVLQNIDNIFTILIYYDPKKLRTSKFTLANIDRFVSRDLIKNLTRKVSVARAAEEESQIKITHIWTLFWFMISIVSTLSQVLDKFKPALKYSTIGEHIISCMEELIHVKGLSARETRLIIEVKSCIFRYMVDLLVGNLMLLWLLSLVSSEPFPELFIATAESVITRVRSLIVWMTGDAGGLKLNYAFNNMLATFFLFHINIWWIFLVFLKPVLQVIFIVFWILGQLGLTFQAAILADLLALVTVHVYFVHAYAARLYNLQITCLISLWRLFLGHKKNPLRQKVDSSRYTPDQLFIGTLGFTILLFLLPTTLMYYIVFTTMRLVVVIVNELLTTVRSFLRQLPVYSSFLWLTNASVVSTSVRLTTKASSANTVVLELQPVPDSWRQTVANYESPFAARRQATASHHGFKQVLNKLLSGRAF